MPKPETDKPRSQPIVNLKLFSTEPPLRPLALQPLALVPLPVCFSSLGQPSHSGGWWPPESLPTAEVVPVLPTSWGKAGRLAWWPQGAPDWKSELGSRPVSATHKFHGPGPVFLEPYGQRGDFSVPGQKMGTTAFKARSRRSHITKGCAQVSSDLGKRLGPDVHPTSS